MTRFLLFFCAASLFAFSAAARPTLEVVRNPPKVERKLTIVSVPVTQCGVSASGCTIPSSSRYGAQTDCSRRRLTVKFDVRGYRIEIVDREKKGTPSFDLVLKHELTHVALWNNVRERYFNATAAEALVRFEKLLNDRTKSCPQIQDEILDLLSGYMERMSEEGERQHALLDGEENYAYQSRQLYMPQKKADKTKVYRNPAVSVEVLKTKRAADVSPADNQTVSGNVVKNLKTRAALEMDRASVRLHCPTGRVNVVLGYASAVAFNEDRGTSLYAYLSDSLNGRVKALEKSVSGVPDKIKADIVSNYKKLARKGMTCGEIRTWLERRVDAYRSKTNEGLIAENNALGDAVPLWRDYFKRDMDAKTAARSVRGRPKFPAAVPPVETPEKFDVAQNAPAFAPQRAPAVAEPAAKETPQTVKSAPASDAGKKAPPSVEPDPPPPSKGALYGWIEDLKSLKWLEKLLEKFKSVVVAPVLDGLSKNPTD